MSSVWWVLVVGEFTSLHRMTIVFSSRLKRGEGCDTIRHEGEMFRILLSFYWGKKNLMPAPS